MSLAEDILNDLQEESEAEYSEHEEELSRPHSSKKVHFKDEDEVETKKTYVEEKESNEEEQTIEKEDKTGIKSIAILISSIVMSYIIIIQYKLTDFVLEKYVENVPLIVKRFVLFSIVSLIIFFSLNSV